MKKHREIVAYDGEGLYAPDGQPQPYVLLAASTGEYKTTAHVRQGLTTRECFTFLLDTAAAHPDARYVMYGLTYDVNMWLRDLPRDVLQTLYDEGDAWWAGYHIEFRARRSFGLHQPALDRGLMIWDIQTWFGGSLEEAIDEWQIPIDTDDRLMIKAGKASRRSFTTLHLKDGSLLAYTQSELGVTVELAEALLRALDAAGVHPARLDGPGGAATKLLGDHGIKGHMQRRVPAGPARAALHAYAGGRQELVQYGYTNETVHHYDIHAAYPWALTQLPSLAGVKWVRRGTDEAVDSEWSIFRVRWSQPRSHGVGRSAWYPFAWRDKDGGMYFPSAGETWVWGPELDAWEDSLNTCADFDCQVEVLDAWHLLPLDPAARPFGWLASLHNERRSLEHVGAPSARVVKAAMNAIYGKLMQTVRYREQEPPYYQIEWAGLVTSYVRARLLAAAAQAPQAVIAFATDGLFTTRPLSGLDEGPGLGQWSHETLPGMLSVQSGVYCLPGDAGWQAFTRGYSPRALNPTDPVDAQDKLAQLVFGGWMQGQTQVDVPQTRFVGLASYLLGDVTPKWRSWVTEPRTLELGPTGKRAPGVGQPARGLILSHPAPIVESLARKPKMSTAYARTWRPSPQMLVEGLAPALYEEEAEEAML